MNTKQNQRIVETIKNLIKRTRLMRYEVAERLNVSDRTVARWLKGQVVPSMLHYLMLQDLADACGRDSGVTR